MGISIKDVSYRYPGAEALPGSERAGWALRHVNLEIEKGELIGVIGQNGAGKSTFCLLFNGLVPHFFHGDLRGNVLLDGTNTREVTVANLITRVGVLFQNPFDQLTGVTENVYEEVAFGPENLGLPREETIKRVEEALEAAGVKHISDRQPYALSGGQQQRVALASVLAMQPELLVLDEPTSQLDPIGSDEVFDVIRKMHQKGYTIILAEHKVEALAELATRIIVLDEGKVVMDGSPRDVLTNPALTSHKVLPPRYTLLGRDLLERELRAPGPDPLTLDEAESMLKEVMPYATA